MIVILKQSEQGVHFTKQIIYLYISYISYISYILTQDHSSVHNIWHTNLVNKVDRFELFLKLTGINCQIISVSETWLTKGIEHLYDINGYKGFFTSRSTKSAGGSAIYVREDLHADRLEHPPLTIADVTCIQLKLEKGGNIVISQIYRAPNVSDVHFTEE